MKVCTLCHSRSTFDGNGSEWCSTCRSARNLIELADEQEPDVPGYDERLSVYYNRYLEAKQAGLTMAERRLFAESDADIGVLRKLVAAGCPVELIRRIVL